jgi:uncharacterized protein YbjT (DUF2867 family)
MKIKTMNTTTNNKKQTLVLGSTGKTGSRVANRLQAMSWPVRLGSRSADIPFEWNDPNTWDAVLEGMDSVYISFVPDLALPGSAEMITNFSKKAVDKGVTKLVLLSGRGEPEAEECEQVVMKAGADWTIVRCSWFCQNFSEGNFLEQVLSGYVALPAGDMPEPFVDADDIADVAVAALTQDNHNGEVYELTGPRMLSFKEAMDEIAKATGHPIRYQQISVDEYADMLNQYGVPEVYVYLLKYLFGEVFDGRNASVQNGVERALGRKATDFSEYVQKTVKTGVWQQEPANH